MSRGCRTVVRDLEAHATVVRDRAHVDGSAALHVLGVHHQVERHLIDLLRSFAPDGPAQVALQRDAALLGLRGEQVERTAEHRSERRRLEQRLVRTRDLEQAADDAVEPVGLADDHLDHLAVARVAVADAPPEQLRRAAHDAERRADLVRHARRELAEQRRSRTRRADRRVRASSRSPCG